MSVQHENESRIVTEGSQELSVGLPPSGEDHTVYRRNFARRLWEMSYDWFMANTFTPIWLPRSLCHPVVGYLIAVLLEIAAIFITVLLMRLFPAYSFISLLEILAVALVALSWGAGPSLVATLVGICLLIFVIVSPYLMKGFDDIVGAIIFLGVGFTISIVASQTGRARNRAEELAASLARERVRLNTIIETVPSAVSIHDAQGTIMQLNRKGRENVGPNRGNETLADSPSAYRVRTPSGEPLSVEEFPVARALRGETVSGIEMRFLDADGQDHSALASAAPFYDAQGKMEGVVLITHDISQLRQSEREVASRASELEAIIEAMADGVFIYGPRGELLKANKAAREIFALDSQPNYSSRSTRERISQLLMRDENGQLLSEEQWPMVRILNGESFKGTHAMDVMIQALDRREAEISMSGAPVCDANGRIAGGVLIVHDVTERRRLARHTQDALSALLAMAEALVLAPDKTTSTGELTSTGMSKVARRVASLTCSVLGCQRVTITAIEPETEVLHPIAVVGLSPEQEEQWWAQQSQGTRLSDSPTPEVISRLRENEVQLIDMRQAPFNEQPNPYDVHVLLIAPMCVGDSLVGLLVLDYGATDHEYTSEEIALARAVAKLAALVIERERLLRERAEARANELALREANRRMDEFLGMTSHELKTPLTSIKGNTQLTVRQLKNSLQNFQRMQNMLENTERQVNLLDRLVDDLLDISRTDTNHLELNLVPYDLVTLVREVVEEQGRIRPSRVITFDSIDALSALVSVDVDRITQVVTNYLTNALKYSSEDQPVHVLLRLAGKEAYVSVQDEGPGLTVDEQQHIWEKFHRAHGIEVQSSSYGSSSGLGLGLYICKTIVERHQGHVGVESTPNVGSTFWFTLPLLQEDGE